MTPTETAAFGWLREQGYDENGIWIGGNKSPDFITPDQRRWEVKRLVKNLIAFTPVQVIAFRNAALPTTVLFWRDGEAKPAGIADFAELPLGGMWGEFKIYVSWPAFEAHVRWTAWLKRIGHSGGAYTGQAAA